MRLVITHIDAYGNMSTNNPLAGISLLGPGGLGGPVAVPEFTTIVEAPGIAGFLSSRSLEYYLDAGSAPQVTCYTANGSLLTPNAVTLTGYLIDCTNGCSPIVH